MATAVALSGVLVVPTAGATSVEDAQAEADRLAREVETAAEDYNAAEDQITTLTQQLAVARERQAVQQRYIQQLTGQMGGVASAAYKRGGVDPTLNLLTENPMGYLENAQMLDSISSSQGATMRQFEAARDQLAADEASIGTKVAQIEELTQVLAAKKAEIEKQLAGAQQVLADAKRREAERAAAALAASRERDRAAAAAANGGGSATTSGGSQVPVGMRCADVSISAPNDRAAAAIAFACKQVGKPYQWGAEGPNSYDCSGLTMASYASAGVGLPRSSREQYARGTKVSRGEVRAGDLVFWASGSTVSHVGIAISNDTMIDAHSTGEPVEIRSISRLSKYLNYVGATRP